MPNRWQSIIWTNANKIHWHIYVALGGDELTYSRLNFFLEYVKPLLYIQFHSYLGPLY